MKRKSKWVRGVLIGVAALVFGLIVFNPFETSDYNAWQAEVSEADYQAALAIIKGSEEYITRYSFISFLDDHDVEYGLTGAAANLLSPAAPNDYGYEGVKAVDVRNGQNAVYSVTVATKGLYYFVVDYYVLPQVLNNLTLAVKVNDSYPYDDAKTIDVPLFWRDDSKTFVLDTYGDESLPTQQRVVGWRELALHNNTYTTTLPLLFELEAGVNTIEIQNVMNGAMLLGDLVVVAPKTPLNYAAYAAAVSTTNRPVQTIAVNATEYIEKNSSYVRLYAYQSPSVTPFDVVNKKLNVINGAAWTRSGHEVTYTFEVSEAGLYEIAVHYSNDKDEYSVFRAISIDGEIPFTELEAYEFTSTGASRFKNGTLGDEDHGNYLFDLAAGTHTISFRAVVTPLNQALRDIQLMVDHINSFALNIMKITGADIDTSRQWQFTNYIPETVDYLESYDKIIKYQVVQLSQYSLESDESATLSYLKTAVNLLKKILEEPDKVPLYLSSLYSGTGSITQMLGDSINALQSQQLYLDQFYVHNEGDLGRDNASFFAKLASNLRSFTSSFTEQKYVTVEDPEAINIWVNRSLIYVDLMQKMADQAFGGTDIKIKISIMPDANKLILANAAGNTPDIALGLPSYMPFDLAIRGALQDLSEFDDFWGVADDFASGAFIPYILEDKVYAMPETLEFHALVYRTDTMRSLGLTVPDTWDDVIDMLPTLQRYAMNFYYPTSGGGALKWFYQTSPLIYQNGASIYSPDGLSTTINSEQAYRGLKLLSDLYTTYSLPSQVASFYNSFRYNTLPIGIIDFGTYLTLKNAAPELAGGWELGLYPGVEDENGDVQRWYIANGTSAIMFKTEDQVKKAQSWEFMKWWMSTETQTEFSFLLQSTYGPEFVWLSGNLEAVQNSPIDPKDLAIILEQVKWLVDVPRTPGQYMLERGLSDIWNQVTFDGTPIRVAIDDQVLKINREITKKMVEFGYLDAEGNVLVPYTIRDTAWVNAQIDAYHSEHGEG
jgi:ABC-type glycerol-3-phosphate transport system substrate-binding protein